MKINKILSPLKLSKAHIRNWNLVRSQDVTQWDKPLKLLDLVI